MTTLGAFPAVLSLHTAKSIPMTSSNREDRFQRKTGAGISIGLVLGVAIGILMDELAMGIALGLALGAAFEADWPQKKQS